ncbi:MAG: hypothetical protein M1814_006828 [Vezdaea aestivalis]|nr:MAG: hypothetical protein M1814_006828 [Vezdaea aestivalis]
MQYSTILSAAAAVALLSATSVSGTCFQSGANWGNHGVAKARLAEACKSMKGHYDAKENYSVCRNSGGNSYVFQIKNNNNQGVEVSESYCNAYIGEQIDRCGHGGKVTHSGVEYRGDPNLGLC